MAESFVGRIEKRGTLTWLGARSAFLFLVSFTILPIDDSDVLVETEDGTGEQE